MKKSIQLLSKKVSSSLVLKNIVAKSVRRFSKRKPTNVALASFYPETEYFKEGMVILKNLSPEQQAKLSYGLIPYPKIPRDPNVEVFLERSPSNSYQFNEKEALKRGVLSLYSQSTKNTGFLVVIDGENQTQQDNLPINFEPLKGASFISIKFIPQVHSNEITPKQQLDKYITESKLRYLEKVGHWGAVQPVSLHPELTSHLQSLPNAALRFSGDSDDEKGLQYTGKYVFFLRTDAGFWEVTWQSHLDDLESNKTFFVDIISQLRVKFSDGRILKPTKTTNTNTSKAVAKTVDFNALLSKLLGKKR